MSTNETDRHEMRWTKATGHEEFECGDSYLVAVPVRSRENANVKYWWEYNVITATETGWDLNGESGWGWDWPDVEWYIPCKSMSPSPVADIFNEPSPPAPAPEGDIALMERLEGEGWEITPTLATDNYLPSAKWRVSNDAGVMGTGDTWQNAIRAAIICKSVRPEPAGQRKPAPSPSPVSPEGERLTCDWEYIGLSPPSALADEINRRGAAIRDLRSTVSKLEGERDEARKSHNFHMHACATVEAERNRLRNAIHAKMDERGVPSGEAIEDHSERILFRLGCMQRLPQMADLQADHELRERLSAAERRVGELTEERDVAIQNGLHLIKENEQLEYRVDIAKTAENWAKSQLDHHHREIKSLEHRESVLSSELAAARSQYSGPEGGVWGPYSKPDLWATITYPPVPPRTEPLVVDTFTTLADYVRANNKPCPTKDCVYVANHGGECQTPDQFCRGQGPTERFYVPPTAGPTLDFPAFKAEMAKLGAVLCAKCGSPTMHAGPLCYKCGQEPATLPAAGEWERKPERRLEMHCTGCNSKWTDYTLECPGCGQLAQERYIDVPSPLPSGESGDWEAKVEACAEEVSRMPRPTATQVRIAIRRHLPAPAPVTVEGLGVKEWAEIAVRMGKYSYKHTANREDYLFTDNRGWCYTGCQSARFKTPEAALAAWWQSRTGRGE